ncbi:MAG: lipid IV(A) 3-deoxy-D-manno-octulosonic acid transferase [Gallionella sp.]|nr:lipid IV(A) 3-deoxy-D-manno-octulosonic acid transferase [Gallionella sp.]
MMKLFDSRFAYTALLWLLFPYVFLHLWWRSRKQPEYLDHIAERFGRYTVNAGKPVIWLHTVSVGETRAAATLVRRLREKYPDHRILLTHTTPTGRVASEQLYGDDVIRVYLPYDYPFAVRRFLDHFKPQVGVLLETEVWFNLIRHCNASHTPLLLLNARLSEKSASKYARLPRLTHEGLHGLYLIAAQTDADAQRLAGLCGRAVSTMGNLKFDIEPPAHMLELGRHLRSLFGSRPIFLAASTREGEEELLLNALQGIADKNVLTVIVPRHPQRFGEVENLIEQHGFRTQRRSADEAISGDTQIVLGDSMGEMFAYYAACDIAFIGGSLLPLGGQNLIEACAVGKPVLIGPHTYNFAQATKLAVSSGAAIQVNDAEELISQLNKLLNDAAHSHSMAQAGLRFVNENQGATMHALRLMDSALRQKA